LGRKLREIQNEGAAVQRADRRIGGILLNLKYLRDARAVRLIAPFLDEPDVGGPKGDENSKESIPVRAMMVLREMARNGVFKPEGVPTDGDDLLRAWRGWWQVHRAEFGPIYELPKTHSEPEPPARNVLQPKEPQAAQVESTVTTADQPLAAVSTSSWRYSYWIFLAVALLILAGAFLYRALQRRKPAEK
jgi:hypothetical protein